MELYYDTITVLFKLDENANLTGFNDFEEYHYDWVFKHIQSKNHLMELFNIWVNMQKDKEEYKPKLVK